MQITIGLAGGEVVGDDSGGDGSCVVLLHPGWGDSSIWDPVMDRIVPEVRVIRYDTRGVGRSLAPTAAFTSLADLITVLDQLDVTEAVVVGHSGGGATALSLALTEPHRVRSLVLAAPGVSNYPWPQRDAFFTAFDALFAAGDREGLVALGLDTWARSGADDQVQRQIRIAVDGMFAQADYLRPDPPTFDQLDRITAPTEILVGEQDHPMIIDCADAISARLPNSHLTRLPRADHMLPLREPAQLAERILAAAN